VNVSAALITESLSNSQLTGFKRIVELVQANAGQLGRFLAEDPQGRQVPEYLRALARYWEEEQTASLKELERLNKNIQHIKDIIGRQQSLTGMSGFAEQVYISELVEDALTLGAANLERSGITVIREFHMHEPMLIDRMKFMLVFVNLINNARDSLLESTVKDKQLKVRTELRPDRYLRVEVIDNGSGIAPGNMTRIFSHGFTTKKTGHGFGLHSSALAAKEMGGTLNVQSDGPGKGACFIIEMPLQPLPAKGSVS
jgi:signal transduction histidine kinase